MNARSRTIFEKLQPLLLSIYSFPTLLQHKVEHHVQNITTGPVEFHFTKSSDSCDATIRSMFSPNLLPETSLVIFLKDYE